MDVVLGPGWPGVMLHEAVGHGLEGDFNRKKSSAFAGLMGRQVAAKGVTVVDDGTIASRRGSLSIDDEGTPTNRTVLIEDGILVGYMQDRQNARLMNMKPTGNGRRESHAHVPMPRMTNTYMLAGGRDPAEILASVKNGIYAVNFGGGQVDITSGKYVFQVTEAYKIENGKLGAPLKGAMLIGNGPTDLHRVSMVGSDMQLDTGIGTCGKNGQGVPVGVGQPTLRMDRITVGGTQVRRSGYRSRGYAHSKVSAHDAGHAARLAPRLGQPVLEVAARDVRPQVAGPHVGPGTAAVLALAGLLAGFAGRIGRQIEVAVVAAGAVDRHFHRAAFLLHQSRTLDAGHAALVLDRRLHLALEPAYRAWFRRPCPDRRTPRRGSALPARSALRIRPDLRTAPRSGCSRLRAGRTRPAPTRSRCRPRRGSK